MPPPAPVSNVCLDVGLKVGLGVGLDLKLILTGSQRPATCAPVAREARQRQWRMTGTWQGCSHKKYIKSAI